MKKKVPVVTVAEPKEAAQLAGLPLEATVALADLANAVKDGLLGFCADVGLMVMYQVMEDELTRRIGPKHARLPERTANWHGTTTGPVVLGGRLLSVGRPRGRTHRGRGNSPRQLGRLQLQGPARPAHGRAGAGGGGYPPARRCVRAAHR